MAAILQSRIRALMEDEYIDDGIRYNAARAILELHFKGCEFADIEQSIAELRKVLNPTPTQRTLRVV